MPPKTHFFRTCLGVFQGGGCRAAAFGGAYAEATAHGVQFAEVAGTSAGSIVAALVGAGIGPDKLLTVLRTLDFRTLLIDPALSHTGILSAIAARSVPRSLRNLIFGQGLHSPSEIKTWVERELQELLPGKADPFIRFKHLPLPTSIVATDLAARDVKVWSKRKTPEDSVAHAVHASCSIPLFFQPVDQNYVDGGVLSNLPSFVFSGGDEGERPLASRVLAFALQEEQGPLSPWGTVTLLKLLANAIVDGHQSLQRRLQPDVHIIHISTGNVRATDFDRMDGRVVETLVQNGVDATRAFFDRPLTVLPAANRTLCRGKEELFTTVAEHLDRPVDDVLIAEDNTDWVYSMFPTLFLWRAQGRRIRVIVPEHGDRIEHGPYRRALLRALGIDVFEVDALPFRAYIFDARIPDRGRAIVSVNRATGAAEIEAVKYEGYLESAAIQALADRLERFCTGEIGPDSQFTPALKGGGHDELIAALRKVNYYASSDVQITVENVEVASLFSLAAVAREFKYRQIEHLVQAYTSAGISVFEPTVVRLSRGRMSLVTPPVIEATGTSFVLIDGACRAKYCLDNDLPRIQCVVVRNVAAPLPARPIKLVEVRLVNRTLDTATRFMDFNYTLFRHLEQKVHAPDSLG